MKENDFLWLQKWYKAHCDGDWEHSNGIQLGTIDNPGWSLTIDLQDTELEDRQFERVELERSKDDWIFCTLKDGKFEGRCGIENLSEVLKLFRDWLKNCK